MESIRQVASANKVGRGQGLNFHIGNTPCNRFYWYLMFRESEGIKD
jgi:hypothetical protein